MPLYESRTPGQAGSEAAFETGPDPAVQPGLAPSLPSDADHLRDAVDDRTADAQPPPNDSLDVDQAVTTPWAAEPDEEPQFRFGIGETRRYE